jgi:mannonate dehydratase
VAELSPEARDLVQRCFADVDRSLVWDLHVHMVGAPESGNGCWVNPDMRSHLHPVMRLQFESYVASSGITDVETADRDFLDRLLALQRHANPDGRIVLLAFDYRYDERGETVPEGSVFYVPTRYVLELAEAHPELEAGASIHPYRADALDLLDEAADRGALLVKWLPNAMGIDPSSPRCDPFYRKLVERGVTLLSHTGKELAVASAEDELGNPLLLRRALDHGVRVVAAHCAGVGKSLDLDRGDGTTVHVPAFDLLVRMFREPAYEGNLLGDISAVTMINHAGRPLRELLTSEDLHSRLVNGSDYPVPAIGPVINTWQLQFAGYLDADVRSLCAETFDANPLLFDYVSKRCLRVERDGRTHRFPPSVFETARLFPTV